MSEKEILERLDRLEQIVNYTTIPKLIEERKKLLEKATDENEIHALQVQIKNLEKHLVGFATLLDLYGAHNPLD